MGTQQKQVWRRQLNLLIDNDCGVDDAGALMMAFADEKTRVIGLSTVAGNVSLEQVTVNNLKLLSYFNREDIPVYPGAHRPLIEPVRDASGIHGSNGLGGVDLPTPRKSAEVQRAPEGLYDQARENPGCTIAALGPLTNLACAFVLYPDLTELVGNLIIMGGALDRGNVTRYAEFNAAADPEAAEIVLNTGVPVTLIPWDVCFANIFTEAELMELGLESSKAGKLFLDINAAPMAYFEKFTGRRMSAMADEIAMACCLDPQVVTGNFSSDIHLELSRTTMRGATVTSAGSSITVVTRIDKNRFIDSLSRIKDLS